MGLGLRLRRLELHACHRGTELLTRDLAWLGLGVGVGLGLGLGLGLELGLG